MKIVWTTRALDQIHELRQYIAKDAPARAEKFTEELIGAVTTLLEDFPLAGRHVPERNDPNLREYTYKNYRVIYRVMTDHLRILTIIHARQQYL